MFRTGNKTDPAPPEESSREHKEHKEHKEVWTPQEVTMQERTKQAPSDASLNALLGRGSQFDGKLTFEGTVRIDGTFTGEISTNDMLIIGEGAKVTADITCGSVIVNGEVNGNIKASEMVELHKPAKVKGDVATPSFMVEKGVMFDGAAKMETAGSNLVTLNRPHREARDARETPAAAEAKL
jgi:cytoskeletal protein CcmA (bactofilin family)